MDDRKLSLTRREIIAGAAATGFALTQHANALAAVDDVSKIQSTISQKSVAWLKSKGWWPLQVHINPTWSDGNLVVAVMKENKLLEKRGIETNYQSFTAASYVNAAYIPGHLQVAQAGELGLYAVMGLEVPTAAVVVYPAQLQGFMVPPNSPLKSLSDLKDQKVLKRPAVYGVTIGSTPQLGWQIASTTLGLTQDKDYKLANLSPADIITMPAGIDVAGIWEPLVSQMTLINKNARVLEPTGRYEFFSGYSYIRGEIAESAPDVIQAYVDAFVEAQLWADKNQSAALAMLIKQPLAAAQNPKLLKQQANLYNFWPKPTKNYPFKDTHGFWTGVLEYQSSVAHQYGFLKQQLTSADFEKTLRPDFMANTYKRLGWAVPAWPMYVPKNWSGVVGKPPYPAYLWNGIELSGPEPFPTKSDLA
jgi:ABC-type nitrate/sulfonate/bicarbonate transport system substrate-binding protein